MNQPDVKTSPVKPVEVDWKVYGPCPLCSRGKGRSCQSLVTGRDIRRPHKDRRRLDYVISTPTKAVLAERQRIAEAFMRVADDNNMCGSAEQMWLVVFPGIPLLGPNGRDRRGYDRDGYNQEGYDRNGYDRDGWSRSGYHRDGYDRRGYNRAGRNRSGYNENSVRASWARYDAYGYDQNGYDQNGYDRSGYSRDGLRHPPIEGAIWCGSCRTWEEPESRRPIGSQSGASATATSNQSTTTIATTATSNQSIVS